MLSQIAKSVLVLGLFFSTELSAQNDYAKYQRANDIIKGHIDGDSTDYQGRLDELERYARESERELRAYYEYQVSYFVFLQKGFDYTDESVPFLRKAYSNHHLLPDSLLEIKFDILNNFGTYFYKNVKLDSARQLYLQALRLVYENGDGLKHKESVILSSLIEVAFSVQNIQMAKEYLDKMKNSLSYAENEDKQLTEYYFRQGRYHFNTGQYDSATFYFIKELEQCETLTEPLRIRHQTTAYSYLANINFDTENYEQALKYDLLSLDLELQRNYPSNLIASYNNIGEDYLLVGKPDSALAFYQKALALADELKIASRKLEVLNNLQRFYKEQANTEKAYELLLDYNNIRDTLIRFQNNQKYDELLRQYESDKQLSQIQNQRAEIDLLSSRQRILRLQIVVGVVCIAAIVMLIAFTARTRIRNKSLEAQRLKEISDFKASMVGMIAHDLKNPLSIILNGVDQEMNQVVARQMLQLVNNMLDVQRLESSKMELSLGSVNLFELVSNLQQQLLPLLQVRSLSLVCQMKNVIVHADKSVLERIMTNLLTNAIKFSPSNGEIFVRADMKEDKVKISVIDQGDGVAVADQEKIFESFGQVEAKNSGGVGSTGLGLTFCKLAVAAHGSGLVLDSDLGKGANFNFILDLVGQDKLESKERETDVQLVIPPGQKKQIESQIDQLRQWNLYQIGEIESSLGHLLGMSQQVDDWVEKVLNAAYDNNRSKYDELLNQISSN